MEVKFSRRQFGQAAIATTATAALGFLVNKTNAQQIPSGTILGVSLGLKGTDTDNLPVIVQSLNLANGQIQNVSIAPVSIQTGEQISGFTALQDGSLMIAVTPVSSSPKGADPVRLINLSATPPQSLNISGLNSQQKIAGFVQLNDGSVVALVVKKNGTPPARLYDINIQTGEIADKSRVSFPGNLRVSALTQCSNGTLYAVSFGESGAVTLIELSQNLKKPVDRVELKLNGASLNNGLKSLTCSSNNQLVAFGARRYVQPNSVYLVDESTGNLTSGIEFNAVQVTFLKT